MRGAHPQRKRRNVDHYLRDQQTQRMEELLSSINETLRQILTVNESLLEKFNEALATEAARTSAVVDAKAVETATVGATVTNRDAEATFTIFLSDAGQNKVNVMKLVYELTGMGLKEAKDRVEAAPNVIQERIPQAQAERIQKGLIDAGATVELIACDL